MKRKNKIGFTLVELLVVMSIIAILSGISLFALQGARESGRDARRQGDLETVRSALELYRADCGQYPPALDLDDITALVGNGTTCPTTNIYLQVQPGDATAGRNYAYSRTTTTSYLLCASLEAGGTTVMCGGSCGTASCNYLVRNP